MVDVDIDYNQKKAIVKCPDKTKATYTISPAPGGFIFYKIDVDTGAVNKDLAGRYSGLDVAVKMLTKHLNDMPKTMTVRRDENNKARKERKNATGTKPKGGEQLQQGVDN